MSPASMMSSRWRRIGPRVSGVGLDFGGRTAGLTGAFGTTGGLAGGFGGGFGGALGGGLVAGLTAMTSPNRMGGEGESVHCVTISAPPPATG